MDSPCVLWTKGRSMGYGMAYDGERPIRAHRLAWIEANGPIGDGLHVHHVCGVKLCVNVAHLQLLTSSEHSRLHAPPLPDACKNGHPFPESLRPGRRECAVCLRRPRVRRTHCKHGHEYAPENTSIRPGGWRRCLTCHRDKAARYKLENPERIREVNRRATKRYYERHRKVPA